MASIFDKISGKKDDKPEDVKQNEIKSIEMSQIVPNRYQPRTEFDQEAIAELAKTIDEHGLLQPIVVREADNDGYEIIAGERRYRAVKKLGWKQIDAIVNNLNDNQTASMGVIENLQRENLNPIEEAEAYLELMRVNDLTQAQLSQQLGKSQSYIANKLRLLKLSEPVKEAIASDEISQRHGRAILALKSVAQQVEALGKVTKSNLNVQQTENLVEKMLTQKTKTKKKVTKTAVNRNIKIAANTIKKSVSMIEDTGMKVQTQEHDGEDEYEIVIKIKK